MITKLGSNQQAGVLKVLLLLMALGLGFVLWIGVLVYLSVRPDQVFRDLQARVLDELPQRPSLRVAVRAPSALVSLARFGLSFVDEIDDEARLAMKAVRGGQVGVYQLARPVPPANRLRIMNRADEAMTRNNWSRVAAVVERDEMVLVYMPKDFDDPDQLEVLTLVLGNEELVIASARGDLRPIYEIVQPHLDEVAEEISREFN